MFVYAIIGYPDVTMTIPVSVIFTSVLFHNAHAGIVFHLPTNQHEVEESETLFGKKEEREREGERERERERER